VSHRDTSDDLPVYLSGFGRFIKKDLDEMIFAINEDLAAISRWSADNGLLLNPRKSQAFFISNSAVGMVLHIGFLGTEELGVPDTKAGQIEALKGICLWNQLPLAIKNFRSVAVFIGRAVMERMRTNLT
jgi:hypothetical protein